MNRRPISEAIRVVLVDDHLVFREGLAAILGAHPDIALVGDASDLRSAVAVTERARPDVVVLDIGLPGASGLDVARELVRVAPRVKILLLTMHRLQEYIEEALAAGVSGYALKTQPSSAIVDAIRTVARGELYLAPARHEDAELGGRTEPASPTPDVLTKREREIFDLVVGGLSNEAIGKRLFISVKTVETHRARINRKLNVHSTAGLVRFAVKHGWLAR